MWPDPVEPECLAERKIKAAWKPAHSAVSSSRAYCYCKKMLQKKNSHVEWSSNDRVGRVACAWRERVRNFGSGCCEGEVRRSCARRLRRWVRMGGVYDLLKKDGYDVTIFQNPTTSLADDVAVTKRAIAAAPGKVILVGHSYGGVVVSEAGTDSKVAGIVYIAAFAPDVGESVASLIANPPPGAPVPPILPPVDGFLLLDKAKFAASFAAEVRPDLASFMADSQVLGAWKPWMARSPHRLGRSGPAGTLSPPTTG